MSNSVCAQPFSCGWTPTDFQAWLLAERERPPEGDTLQTRAWLDRMTALSDKRDQAVIGHVSWLMEQGRFSMPQQAQEVQLNWIAALQHWVNADAKGSEDSTAAALQALEPFLSALSFWETKLFVEQERRPVTPEQDAALYKRMVDYVEAGNFDWRGSEARECFWSGARIRVQATNWSLTLGLRGADGSFEPLREGQLGPPPIGHVTIDCPSGELLLTDWFRLPAFQAAAAGVSETLPSINNEAGCIARTQAYATQLGFASVFASDRSPDVFLMDGRLICAHAKEEAPASVGLNRRGNVITDYWWVTLIDRETLVGIAANGQPRDVGVAAVEELERTADQKWTRVQVPPGQYHLYFAGDPTSFGAQFKMEELSLSAFSQSMFVLSPSALTPVLQSAHSTMDQEASGTPPVRRKLAP